MPLAPGTRLGPYEIVELAGAGGMGEFYKAHDTRLRRAVALKIATGSFGDDGETRGQFEREARAIAALNHPHICAIHDVASFDGHDVIVMEYLDGETLQQRLRRGPLPIPELLRHAIAIAEALVAAHREGVVHRDLKPSNVMLTRTGVKLLDFGIARRRTSGDETGAPSEGTGTTQGTIEGRLIGTVPYMAPEQLEGRHARVSRRVDGSARRGHSRREAPARLRDRGRPAARARSGHLRLPRAEARGSLAKRS
jgi:serine/threonine protein kinase